MQKKKLYVIGLLLLLTPSSFIFSQTRKEQRWNYTKSIYKFLWKDIKKNPSALDLLPLKEDISLYYKNDFAKYDEASFYNIYEGSKLLDNQIKAEGYVKNDNGSIAFGMAQYERGIHYQTKGRDIVDYELFYPYLISECRGGDYQKELYTIRGGYSQRFLKKWHCGIEGEYKGGIGYRVADPRPENRVSSYKVGAGVSYYFDKYVCGLFIKYNYYQQDFNVLIRQAGKKTLFYSMRGMGLIDYMYSEMSESYQRFLYNNAFIFGLSFYPKSLKGFSLDIDGNLSRVKEVNGFECIPVFLDRLTMNTSCSYLWTSLAHSLLRITNKNSFVYAKGAENQYEKYLVHRDPDIIGYKLLVTNLNHSLCKFKNEFTIDYLYTFNKQYQLNARIKNVYTHFSEKYMQNLFYFTCDNIANELQIGGDYIKQKFRINTSVNLGHRLSLKSKKNLPSKGEAYALDLSRRYYAYQKANYGFAGIQIQMQYAFNHKISLDIQSSYQHCWGSLKTNSWVTQIGLLF